MEEDICNDMSNKGLIHRICKELIQRCVGRGLEQALFYIWQTYTQKKMLNTTDHQENTNQKHHEVSSHTCKNGYCLKDKKQTIFGRMWRKGNPCALFVGI